MMCGSGVVVVYMMWRCVLDCKCIEGLSVRMCLLWFGFIGVSVGLVDVM